MTKAQLLDEAKRLGPDERAELIEDLRQTVVPSELTREQRDRIRQRIEGLDSGAVASIDGAEVLREARDRVRQARGA